MTGQELKTLREAAGMTQRALGAAAFPHMDAASARTMIARYENATTNGVGGTARKVPAYQVAALRAALTKK